MWYYFHQEEQKTGRTHHVRKKKEDFRVVIFHCNRFNINTKAYTFRTLKNMWISYVNFYYFWQTLPEKSSDAKPFFVLNFSTCLLGKFFNDFYGLDTERTVSRCVTLCMISVNIRNVSDVLYDTEIQFWICAKVRSIK